MLKSQYEEGLKALDAEQYQEAITVFTQVIQGNYKEKEVYARRGQAYFLLKDYNKAKSDLDEAVKSHVNTDYLFAYRGLTHYELKKL